MKAPIHSVKHYHQMTLSNVSTLTEVDSIMVHAIGTGVAASPNEVVEGAIVKAVYLEMWVIGSSSNQFFTMIVHKTPNDGDPATFTEMTSLGTYINKKNILFTSQGLASNDGIAQPVAVHRSWIRIPKGKQRFGLGDKLLFQIASRGSATITFCGFATYKEYT